MNIAAINRLRFFNSPTGLYVFTTFTFTPAGATGVNGPTAGQFSTAYSGQSFFPTYFTSSAGIQSWTVPMTGNYQIEARGAQGGNSTSTSYGNFNGELGAAIKGTVTLTEGQIIKILVGHTGGNTLGDNRGGGGGGASFVTTITNTPLIIAGGGGGAGQYASIGSGVGQVGTSGTAGLIGTFGAGGTSGNGGVNGSYSGGGGGLTGNGISTTYGKGGLSFTNGGTGGLDYGGGGTGGFGGGGGSYAGAGGAGGYSGGGAGGWSYSGTGGGGGSYNAGTNQTNTAGVNTGNGYVIITKV